MGMSDLPGARLASCLVCHECDLLVDVSGLAEGFRAQCPRCACTLCNAHRNPAERILIYCASAFICLVMSCMFDFLQLTTAGNVREISLPETVQELFALREWALAAFIGVIIIALPVGFIAALVWLLLSIRLRFANAGTLRLLRFVSFLRFWNMAEIFFLGILISMV
jgi:paraquat-inducible protein A